MSRKTIADTDVAILEQKEKEYGSSWKRRGGIGAFMMLARKWDRLEEQVKQHGYDIFKACAMDKRPEGIRDDIGDLRRYLLLVEEELANHKPSSFPGQYGRPFSEPSTYLGLCINCGKLPKFCSC